MGPPQLATGGRRVGAFAIDLVFGLLSFLVVGFIVGFVIGLILAIGSDEPLDEQISDETLSSWVIGVWIAFYVGATWIQNAIGASLGKRILSLRIVRADQSRPGIGVGLGRTLAAWLSWPLLGLGFLWAFWDDRGQTWHDKLAGTYVVHDPNGHTQLPETRIGPPF